MQFKICYIPVLLLILTSLLPSKAHAQRPTTFLLLRHAETVDNSTRDPGLSETGRERAGRLAGHLRSADIGAIYSTSFKRTKETVGPVAETKGLEINEYDPFDPNLLDAILLSEYDGTVVIAGHSNTTPALVNALIGEERFEPLPESDHSTLYFVTVTEPGKGTVLRLHY